MNKPPRKTKRERKGDGLTIDEKIKVRCFCGQWVTIGETADGLDSMIHPEPACAKFMEDRPGDEFIRELRESGADVALPDHLVN